MLLRLVYASVADPSFRPTDLAGLLKKARDKNARLGVSGALLVAPGLFLQLLEGEFEKVNALYARIATDPRHSSVFLLGRSEIARRSYAQWSMGALDASSISPERSPFISELLRGGIARLAEDPLLPDRVVRELSEEGLHQVAEREA